MPDYKSGKNCVLWFTGLSGSGKSTLAEEICREMSRYGTNCYALDGDIIRKGLSRDLKFSREDRSENIRRIAEVSRLFLDAGILTIVAFISPFRKDREMARSLFGNGEFIEVFIKCSLRECEKRDPKGLYKKARQGILPEFTGISSPYEAPFNPEIIVETNIKSITECVSEIVGYLMDNGYIITAANYACLRR